MFALEKFNISSHFFSHNFCRAKFYSLFQHSFFPNLFTCFLWCGPPLSTLTSLFPPCVSLQYSYYPHLPQAPQKPDVLLFTSLLFYLLSQAAPTSTFSLPSAVFCSQFFIFEVLWFCPWGGSSEVPVALTLPKQPWPLAHTPFSFAPPSQASLASPVAPPMTPSAASFSFGSSGLSLPWKPFNTMCQLQIWEWSPPLPTVSSCSQVNLSEK